MFKKGKPRKVIRLMFEVHYWKDGDMTYMVYKPDKRKANSQKKWERCGGGIFHNWLEWKKEDKRMGPVETLEGSLNYAEHCMAIEDKKKRRGANNDQKCVENYQEQGFVKK